MVSFLTYQSFSVMVCSILECVDSSSFQFLSEMLEAHYGVA